MKDLVREIPGSRNGMGKACERAVTLECFGDRRNPEWLENSDKEWVVGGEGREDGWRGITQGL